ncbi:T9SS type A sorting domain-containing protein [Polaribacter sp. R77954]|uniref:T9SS type A sorting domain-containing protein n=1 Tax=Polaribacter sp. R77954 TaxID=3093870 RepID=UPI0037CA7873
MGYNISNASYKLSANLGEVTVGNMAAENGDFQLSNGYYLSLDLKTLDIDKYSLNNFIVYPNPVKDIFYVSNSTETYFDVYLSDPIGKILFKARIQNKDPINISNYPKGVYLLKITTGQKKTNTYKIIKL